MDRESAKAELRKHLVEYLRAFHSEVQDIKRPFCCQNPDLHMGPDHDIL